MKVLILGGYGTFGGRLAGLLLDEPRLTLLIAGRSLNAAERFCSSRTGKAKLVPLELDRQNAGASLQNLQPDLVIDASGPFQTYGGDPYRFVRDCIEAGADYADLADGADFVAGISALNEVAKTRGRFALSGMSSFPVLTAAVFRLLALGLDRVDSVTAGIAPSPFAGVGLNVIRAIASYAGRPVNVLCDGRWEERAGFVDSRRLTVNVPGQVPLRPIRFALADVPDLQILSWDWPQLKSVWVGAGPTPVALHRLLWLAAGAVKLRLLPSLAPLAPVMNWVVNTVRWGEHRGGMMVEVVGEAAGRRIQRSWHLLAEGDGGPLIPSMAAEAIIRHCLDGRRPAPGARSGHRDLELKDYAPLLARRGIKTGFRDSASPAVVQSVYQQVMGEAFVRLADPLQKFHVRQTSFKMQGKADVERGHSLFAKLIHRLFGFPAQGRQIDVCVTVDFDGAGEIWQRTFAASSFQSRQRLGHKRCDGLMVESFGPFNFGMAVTENQGTLGLLLRGWDIGGLPLPHWAMPLSQASEHDADGRVNFDVEIGLPFFGRIVRYQGWLEPAN